MHNALCVIVCVRGQVIDKYFANYCIYLSTFLKLLIKNEYILDVIQVICIVY